MQDDASSFWHQIPTTLQCETASSSAGMSAQALRTSPDWLEGKIVPWSSALERKKHNCTDSSYFLYLIGQSLRYLQFKSSNCFEMSLRGQSTHPATVQWLIQVRSHRESQRFHEQSGYAMTAKS